MSLAKIGGKHHAIVPELDLVGLQKESYQHFWIMELPQCKEVTGESGIEDYTGKSWALKFGGYRFGDPKYSATEAKRKGVTYDMPLYVSSRTSQQKLEKSKNKKSF